MAFNPSIFLHHVLNMHRRSPYIFLPGFILALMFFLAYFLNLNAAISFYWFSSQIVLLIVQYRLYIRFSKSSKTIHDAATWFLLFISFSFFSGMLWGSTALLIDSNAEILSEHKFYLIALACLSILSLCSCYCLLFNFSKLLLSSFACPAVLAQSYYLFNVNDEFRLLACLFVAAFCLLLVTPALARAMGSKTEDKELMPFLIKATVLDKKS